MKIDFTIFGKRYIIVPPFCTWRPKKDETCWYLWVMKKGVVVLPLGSQVIVNGRTIISIAKGQGTI